MPFRSLWILQKKSPNRWDNLENRDTAIPGTGFPVPFFTGMKPNDLNILSLHSNKGGHDV